MAITIETTPAELPTTIPTETQQLVSTTDDLVSHADRLVVNSPETYSLAGEELKSIVGRKKALEDGRKSITRPMDEAKAKVMDVFRAPIDALKGAELKIKQRISAYVNEQERIRREAQAKADLAARKEREKLARQAAAAAKKGQVEKAELLAQQADTVPAQIIAPPVQKVTGISMRETWSAEVTDVAALVKAAAKNPVLLGFLQPNQQALNTMARAQKAAMSVPGVKAVNASSVAARGRTF